jgi:hypothetical protein
MTEEDEMIGLEPFNLGGMKPGPRDLHPYYLLSKER